MVRVMSRSIHATTASGDAVTLETCTQSASRDRTLAQVEHNAMQALALVRAGLHALEPMFRGLDRIALLLSHSRGVVEATVKPELKRVLSDLINHVSVAAWSGEALLRGGARAFALEDPWNETGQPLTVELPDLSESVRTLAQLDLNGAANALALSQRQVRKLAEQLATTLNAITGDDIKGQALAAAALIAANVTPVVTVHVPFGGDNHTDQDLQNETDQHITGVQGIQAVMDALAMLGLTDKVTFATMNVFGRNLNAVAKVEGRTGRDHFGNHSVMIMIGKNISPCVVGGVAPSGKNNAFGAGDIDSKSGAVQPGGDIPSAQTQLAAARTLGGALGIADSTLAADLSADAGGKVVPSALI